MERRVSSSILLLSLLSIIQSLLSLRSCFPRLLCETSRSTSHTKSMQKKTRLSLFQSKTQQRNFHNTIILPSSFSSVYTSLPPSCLESLQSTLHVSPIKSSQVELLIISTYFQPSTSIRQTKPTEQIRRHGFVRSASVSFDQYTGLLCSTRPWLWSDDFSSAQSRACKSGAHWYRQTFSASARLRRSCAVK